jgi:hypothetical protein
VDENAAKIANLRKALLKRWYALWPITAALILYPINNLPIRIAILLALTALFAGLLYFYWQKRLIRFGTLAFGIIAGLFLLLPGRNPNTSELRQQYVKCLYKYEGTKYIWGGENWLGIDCSGLVRSGVIVANYRQGFFTLNPGLVREGLGLWWHDCSARALGEEYRHKTRLLFSAKSVNEIDYSKILPGDIAITSDGVHAMAYVGDQTWIEADPAKKRVIHDKVPTDNPWLTEPVNIMRWSELDETTPGR